MGMYFLIFSCTVLAVVLGVPVVEAAVAALGFGWLFNRVETLEREVARLKAASPPVPTVSEISPTSVAPLVAATPDPSPAVPAARVPIAPSAAAPSTAMAAWS